MNTGSGPPTKIFVDLLVDDGGNEERATRDRTTKYIDHRHRHRHRQHDGRFRLASRINSAFKWQQDKSVIGALEIPSNPFFDYRGEYIHEPVSLHVQKEFDACLSAWNTRKLKRSFIEACNDIPPSTHCFGIIQDHSKTIEMTAKMLNIGWVKAINKSLYEEGFKISCFAWRWSNLIGKAETTIFLIRFHSLKSRYHRYNIDHNDHRGHYDHVVDEVKKNDSWDTSSRKNHHYRSKEHIHKNQQEDHSASRGPRTTSTTNGDCCSEQFEESETYQKCSAPPILSG